MAQGTSDFSTLSRARCSYKTATFLVCGCNVLIVLYVVNSLLSPFYLFSTSSQPSSYFSVVLQSNRSPLRVLRYSEDRLSRIKETIGIWKAAEPFDLVKRVKEIREESTVGALKLRRSELAREKVASDLVQSLKVFEGGSNQNNQKALEEWRENKLKEARKREREAKSKLGDLSSMKEVEDAEEIAKLLEFGWGSLLEEMGLSEPIVPPTEPVVHGAEIEDDIIPGRPLSPKCHAEPHTDYGGLAVRWGLTHHVGSAADCCQACLDQAQKAKPGEMKCNIWVYCPFETGCFSPDIYEHKHQECWLKQADQPKLNFKGRYDPEYRRQNPRAPIFVPWVSGVTSE